MKVIIIADSGILRAECDEKAWDELLATVLKYRKEQEPEQGEKEKKL